MKAKDVVKVFKEFEDDIEDDELMDSEKVKGVLNFVDRKDQILWKTMDGYDERDYMQFKGSVLEFYLGTKKTAGYLFNQLKNLTEDTRDHRMTPRCLANYHFRFKPLALWLEESDVISTDELDEYFWCGLPKAIRRLIREDLDMYSKEEIPSMKQAFRSARRVVQAMVDEEDDEDEPFHFGAVMETISNSNIPEEFDDVTEDNNITPRNKGFGSNDIVQAVEDVVLTVDGVVWAADRVLAVDNMGRAADGFVQAVDEDMTLDKVMLGGGDDVPGDLETVPFDDETQPIDDEDIAGGEDGFVETREMWRLDDDVLTEDENVPEDDESLPHVPAIEEDPLDLQNAPVAANISLESDEEELGAGEDIPADFEDPEHEASLVSHGRLPAFGDRPAVEDMLASIDDDNIPVECNEFPGHEAMSVKCKDTPVISSH